MESGKWPICCKFVQGGEQVPNEEELLCEDEVEEESDDANSSNGECDVRDSDSDISYFEDY